MTGTVVRKETSPALALGDALPTPADLDGWDSDDVLVSLQKMTAALVERRSVVGLLMWKLRQLVAEAVYVSERDKIAQLCDVDVRTIDRWRVAAETRYALPPPSRRSAAQQAQGAARRTETQRDTPSLSDAPPKAAAKPAAEPKPEPIRPDEVRPPTAPVQQTLPGSEAWGVVRNLSIIELSKFGRDELKSLQRKVSEALRIAPYPKSAANPKRSPASTSGPEVTTFFKKGKK